MSSAFQTITTALTNALSAAPAICHGVFTNLLDPVAERLPTAVVVRLHLSDPGHSTYGVVTWRTVLTVECYARAGARGDPAAAIDPLLQAVWTRLSRLDAQALGVLGVDLIGGGIEWQFDKAEAVLACAVIRVTVRHRTPTDTLSSWS